MLTSAGQVVIPPEVDRELGFLIDGWPSTRPAWLAVERLTPAAAADAAMLRTSGLLDAGEAEAVVLARHLAARWLLTDDAAARVVAAQMGLDVHGSIGVVLGAAVDGALSRDEASRALIGLFDSSLWISSRVRREALSALEVIGRRERE